MKNEEYKKIIDDIEKLKKELGVACQCNDPTCSKCLMVNCKDDNCPVHTMSSKMTARRRMNIN